VTNEDDAPDTLPDRRLESLSKRELRYLIDRPKRKVPEVYERADGKRVKRLRLE
jgi:hypothetical protein